MEYNKEQIGKIIREERKKLGWSQEKLGKKLGITGKQISSYEHGQLLPPQKKLLKMSQFFNCESGYLLGEESYKDRSKLNTAICESLALSSKAVDAIRAATHRGLTQELAERQQAISCFFESPYVGEFFDCLVETITVSKQLSISSDSVYQALIDRYGEEIANKAVIYCSVDGAISDADLGQPELQEAIKDFNTIPQ